MSSPITGFGGFNSGLPVDDIIKKLIAVERKPMDVLQTRLNDVKKKQSVYTSIQSKVNDLLTSLKKLTTRNVDGTSLFDGMLGSSTNAAIATVTVSGQALPQSLNLEVKSLPSQTVATSTAGVGKFDNTTTLGKLGITDGSFTIVANGIPNVITVSAQDTMGDVFSAIHTAVPDAVISQDPVIVNGKIQLNYNGAPNTKISLGMGGDTSNFLVMTNLLTAVDDGAGHLSASQPNTTIDRNQPLSSSLANLASPLTDGSFSINGVSFDTTGKTLNDIIFDINNAAANVTASFNRGTNSFQLVAKNTGSSLISLSEGTGNFLSVMNLVSAQDSTTSQNAGKNAVFVLNGVTMYATSPTVDETVTGLTGVTLNLKQAQPGTEIQISILNDTEALKNAIKDVIDRYNAAITYIDQQTDAKSNAILAGESRLKSLRTQIRSLFTGQIGALASTGFDSLQQVGIGTGAIGSSAGNATPKLQFDTAKFGAAWAKDPVNVKKLFVGQNLVGLLHNTAYDDQMEGVFTQLHHLLSDQTYTDANGNTVYGALYAGTGDNNKGLFAAYQNTAQKRIADMNQTIQKSEDRLSSKEKTLRQQFLAMDKLVGQYQSQGSALNGLIQQLNSNNRNR